MGEKCKIGQGASSNKVNVHTVIFQSFLNHIPGIVAMLVQTVGIVLVVVDGFEGTENTWMCTFAVVILKTIHVKIPFSFEKLYYHSNIF